MSGRGQISRDIPILASVYEGQDRRLSKYEQLIKTMQEIKVYSAAESFNKLGIDIDEYDSEEIEYVLDAALEADRSDIAGAMARNMGPRTLSLASINDEDEKRAIFSLARESGDVGSDEWLNELGRLYHSHAREYGLIDRDYDYLLGTRSQKGSNNRSSRVRYLSTERCH